MTINCTECGNDIPLDLGVYANIETNIRCNKCGALLHIKMAQGQLWSIKLEKPGRKDVVPKVVSVM